MIRIAVGNKSPELMAQNLLKRLLLPTLEHLVVQKLLRILVFGCDIDDELRVDHNRPQNKCSGILLNKLVLNGQNQSLIPMLV